MLTTLRKLWSDESGFIISSELVLIATVGVLGLITAITCVRDEVNGELNDVANAIGSMNQSYCYRGKHGCLTRYCGTSSWTAGSSYTDLRDEETQATLDEGATVEQAPAPAPQKVVPAPKPCPQPVIQQPVLPGPICPPLPACPPTTPAPTVIESHPQPISASGCGCGENVVASGCAACGTVTIVPAANGCSTCSTCPPLTAPQHVHPAPHAGWGGGYPGHAAAPTTMPWRHAPAPHAVYSW